MDGIADLESLRAHFGAMTTIVARKVMPRLDRHGRPFITLSPFLVLATADGNGGGCHQAHAGEPPAPRRLDGSSKILLAASLKTLPEGAPGWITMKEAATLFSQEGDAYAFGEMDEPGKAALAAFASASGNVQFEFMPVQGRLYFMRKAS